MNREPHSPNNASMNINWFKETRAIPRVGFEYFSYRNMKLYDTHGILYNANNLLMYHTLDQIREFADNYIRNKIL